MVSLIIPTLNAGRSIEKLFEALEGQTERPEEIIVIDSASVDNTFKIAQSRGARTISVARDSFDHGGTRTFAGKSARGDILIYMTQDTLPANEYSLENLIKPFSEDNKTGAVYGRQLPIHEASIFGAHLRYFNYPESSYVRSFDDRDVFGIKTAFLSNSFAAYRRDVLEDIGWFKEDLISTEDTYAGAKMLIAGYKIAYAADALVYHSHNYTMTEEFKRYFDIGVFHRTHKWILDTFGKAEGEGIKYIKSEFAFIIKHNKYYLIPEFIVRNILKYVGYKLGQIYGILPFSLIRRFSMHRGWWKKQRVK